MTILCVDPDRKALQRLVEIMMQFCSQDVVHGCRDPGEALRLAEEHGCDLLLTEIEFGRINLDGLMLAEKLKERNRGIKVICVTNCRDNLNAFRAWQMLIQGYLPKPYTPQELADVLAHLRLNPG